MADSLSALVRQSLEMRARQLREEELEGQFQEAARDPLFMADLRECMQAFDGTTGDGLNA
ncbi:hypothetical protein IV102_06095 [bacterium]|nr:hypothetical protein [bacterium]